MLQGFKDFIARGNAIEMAVGIVLGLAFTEVVNAVVDGLITPLIAAMGGVPDLSELWMFELNEAVFSIGAILGAIINFLIVAAALYFVIVMPLNKLAERRKQGVEPEPEAPAEDVRLLQEIRDLLATRREI
ncbi:MAG: large conductance mechanosensitive channel protein MscL [Actinomycetales bacterium]|jgi:large conductance mechanosensitive channel|nr:large conductance mechanosensitive channel protein MscL [Actinomycetales bacterium]